MSDLINHQFPFCSISAVAEQESWRKDIYRPTSYIHKWWARRLGSVFRGLLIGTVENDCDESFERFYSGCQYPNITVFDPFMGSGTTINEAVKLGAKVVGCDINPVSVLMVEAALEKYDRSTIKSVFQDLRKKCEQPIEALYGNEDGSAERVLYYFWIKEVQCDDCGTLIPLYKNTVFSKNAYPAKKPMSKSFCPYCGEINEVHYLSEDQKCIGCGKGYNPQKGNVEGINYVCPCCGKKEKIVDYARRTKRLLPEKMFAKIVVCNNGKKKYLPTTDYDNDLFKRASVTLSKYEQYIPDDSIWPGHNTNQILNYNYAKWRQMFNDRQLVAFGILEKAILEIEDEPIRRLFSILLSGTLEFNNMFCSFKGEGTGAVRPLFYNHILKSELQPLEANVWGGKGSSGGFFNFFETRILRALDYKEAPYEIKLVAGQKSADKYFLPNCDIEKNVVNDQAEWTVEHPLILCGDSSSSGLPAESVDIVLTDPPFFDNVNYSELADFFFVWLKKLNIISNRLETTRSENEVQDNNSEEFSKKLGNVFSECFRVLKPAGHLVFTYHHSRIEGWTSVYQAISNAGFSIIDTFPIKAEMSVSVSIMAAKVPINYDLVFVCSKTPLEMAHDEAIDYAHRSFTRKMDIIKKSNIKFSEGDRLMMIYGEALQLLSTEGNKDICDEIIQKSITQIIK